MSAVKETTDDTLITNLQYKGVCRKANNFTINIMKGLSFSLKRAVGISGLKTKVARKTGIPTTKLGLERKLGQGVLSIFTANKKRK